VSHRHGREPRRAPAEQRVDRDVRPLEVAEDVTKIGPEGPERAYLFCDLAPDGDLERPLRQSCAQCAKESLLPLARAAVDDVVAFVELL
jgi:hypothetical protein